MKVTKCRTEKQKPGKQIFNKTLAWALKAAAFAFCFLKAKTAF
jgi:hypothetical protein